MTTLTDADRKRFEAVSLSGEVRRRIAEKKSFVYLNQLNPTTMSYGPILTTQKKL